MDHYKTTALIVCSLLFLGCSSTSECESIQKPEWRDKCYWDKAVEKKDPSMCNFIVYGEWRGTCLQSLNDTAS